MGKKPHGVGDADSMVSPTPPDATWSSKGNERVFGNKVIGYVRDAWGLPTVAVLDRPSQGVIDEHDGDRGATPNQRGLARIWDYASAPDGELDGPRERLVDFFVKQRSPEGHQYAEGNTSSHGELWLVIGAAARALGLHRRDRAVIEVTGEWWCCEADLDDKLLDPDGYRTGPCGRSAGATYDLGTISANLIRGTQPPEWSLIPNAKGGRRVLMPLPRQGSPGFWQDSYNIGVWMMAELKRRGDDLGGAFNGRRVPVLMRDQINILRRGNESVKWVEFARSSEYLFWCAQLEKRPSVECIETSPGRYEAPHSSGRFPEGRANPFEVPKLPGSSLSVVPGVDG